MFGGCGFADTFAAVGVLRYWMYLATGAIVDWTQADDRRTRDGIDLRGDGKDEYDR